MYCFLFFLKLGGGHVQGGWSVGIIIETHLFYTARVNTPQSRLKTIKHIKQGNVPHMGLSMQVAVK